MLSFIFMLFASCLIGVGVLGLLCLIFVAIKFGMFGA